MCMGSFKSLGQAFWKELTRIDRNHLCWQEAEEARKKLFELRAITSAVESSGQTKAEAQVTIMLPSLSFAEASRKKTEREGERKQGVQGIMGRGKKETAHYKADVPLASFHLPRDPRPLTILIPNPPIRSLLSISWSLALHPPLKNPKGPLGRIEHYLTPPCFNHRFCANISKN